jgi:uncharacterized protein
MRKNIEFYSENCLIKGHLYLPENNEGKLPGIVMCQGFAGIKEMLLPPFAEKFSGNGFAVLTFDYRGFGGSEGVRGLLSASNQVKDIRNATTFMQGLPEVEPERIGIWGSSYGGANAITVSGLDKRIKCTCTQLPFGDGERVILGQKTEEEKRKLLESLNKIWIKTVTKNKGMMMPVNKFLTDKQSIEAYSKYIERFPEMNIKIPFLTMMETIEYKPENYLKNTTIPIHITGAEKDIVNPIFESESIYEKANGPKALLKVNATHFEIYEGKIFDKVSEAQINWYKKYL